MLVKEKGEQSLGCIGWRCRHGHFYLTNDRQTDDNMLTFS
jgi:hypothetical protein